jgi:hypothetical protein
MPRGGKRAGAGRKPGKIKRECPACKVEDKFPGRGYCLECSRTKARVRAQELVKNFIGPRQPKKVGGRHPGQPNAKKPLSDLISLATALVNPKFFWKTERVIAAKKRSYEGRRDKILAYQRSRYEAHSKLTKEWKLLHPLSVKIHRSFSARKHKAERNEYQNIRNRKSSETLTDHYIRLTIIKSAPGLSTQSIPKPLVDLQRERLRIIRHFRVNKPDRKCMCEGCGKIYVPKKNVRSGEGTRFCSRDCAFAHTNLWNVLAKKEPA